MSRYYDDSTLPGAVIVFAIGFGWWASVKLSRQLRWWRERRAANR